MVASQRPSTALPGPFSSSVTSSAGAFPARESRLRRSLRDDSRGSPRSSAVDGDVSRCPPLCPSSAWTAAAARDHRRSVDVDSAVAMATARQRAGTDVGAASPPPSAGAASGGLSLSSTASNDTGYSSIGNSGERDGQRNGDTGTCRPPGCCHGDVGDDAEQRPSVAELRRRFQTHSISQPAELSKRCVASFSPSPSTGSKRVSN